MRRFCRRAAVFQQCVINKYELMKQREVSADREQAAGAQTRARTHAHARMDTLMRYKSSRPQILKIPFLLCRLLFRTPTLHPYLRTSADRQGKPVPGQDRKTLENQDTIWHLWRLNDFLLGVGLCPTGKSQKTGRENYIRENVYVAHSAPSLFCPANE